MLFPLSVGRVVFVDSDQVVRTDLKQLMDLDMKVGGGGRPESIVHVLVALQACLRLGALVRVCALCKHEDVVSAPQPLKTSQNMNMPTNGACPPPGCRAGLHPLLRQQQGDGRVQARPRGLGEQDLAR